MEITINIWQCIGMVICSYVLGVVIERFIQHPLNCYNGYTRCRYPKEEKDEEIHQESFYSYNYISKPKESIFHESEKQKTLVKGVDYCRRYLKSEHVGQSVLCSDCFDHYNIFIKNTYTSIKAIEISFNKWKGRYTQQNYYSSNKGRIPLDELKSNCSIIKTTNKKKK